MHPAHLFSWLAVIFGPPIFETSLEIVIAREGSNATLHCNASGDPLPEYTWLDKNSVEINDDYTEPGDRKKAISSYLYLYNVTEDSKGFFTCKASNRFGTTSKIFQVVVTPKESESFPPIFTSPYQHVSGKENQSLTLLCLAEGNPTPNYTWYGEDGVELDERHPRVRVQNLGNGTLTFPRLSVQQAGNYTCLAENDSGRAKKVFEMEVRSGEPEPARIIYIAVKNVTQTTATFDLQAKNKDSYTGFKAMYSYQTNFRSITGYANWTFGEEYTVRSLTPGTTYTFRFSLSPTDDDIWSEELNVTLPLSRPEIIIREISPQKVKLETFEPIDIRINGVIDHYRLRYKTIQMIRGSEWDYSSKCEITILIPASCFRGFEVSGLQSKAYYYFIVQSHNALGYSEPAEFKISTE